MRDPSCGQLPEQFFCVKSTHGLEILVSTAQGSSHSLEHPREEEHFVTSFGPKRYPSAGRIDCFPRCTSWPRRPPRARPSCRTAGPCRMANQQNCNVPRMSIRLRTMVLDRKETWRTRTSYEAASKRSSPQDEEHQLMPEAIWSMKPNVQSAADSSRTCPRVAFMVCSDRGICAADVDRSKTSTYSSRTCLVTLMCVRGIGHEDSRGTCN